MSIQWDDGTLGEAPVLDDVTWDAPRSTPMQLLTDALRTVYNAPSRLVTGKPLEQVRNELTAGSRAVPGFELLPTLGETALFGPAAQAKLLRSKAGGAPYSIAELAKQQRANLVGSTVASPLDPTTYAFLPASMIKNVPVRAAVSGAVGAAPALLEGDQPNYLAAALQAMLAGGMAIPELGGARPTSSPAAPAPRPRGTSPYSHLLPGEGATLDEAAAAAREGFGTFQRPDANPTLDAFRARYGQEVFPEQVAWDPPSRPAAPERPSRPMYEPPPPRVSGKEAALSAREAADYLREQRPSTLDQYRAAYGIEPSPAPSRPALELPGRPLYEPSPPPVTARQAGQSVRDAADYLRGEQTPAIEQYRAAYGLELPTPAPTTPPAPRQTGRRRGFVELPDEEGVARAGAQALAPTFYSQLERTLEERMPNKASREQIQGIVRSGGVKQEEISRVGLDEFLATKPTFTKQELLDHVRENNVQVQEVVKGGLADKDRLMNDLDEQLSRGQISRRDYEAERSVINRRVSESTKFNQYQLPGGTNYRELLLTVPENTADSQATAALQRVGLTLKKRGNNREVFDSRGIKVNAIDADPDLIDPKGRLATTAEQAAIVQARQSKDAISFSSSHFDEPNVLAHVRFNDRVDAQGKKVLFLEEVQSDWHQQGRKQGYKSGEAAIPTENIQPQPDGTFRVFIEGPRGFTSKIVATRDDAVQWLRARLDENAGYEQSGVPDAPFKKTWHELALKRMLRYAAEHGYDKLAWTTGEQQAERYDLSKHIDAIRFKKFPDGRIFWNAEKNGERITGGDSSPAELPGVVGKEAAEKILARADDGPGVLSGLDLKVGGEGMKGFYDQMVPSFLNQYAKKWGGRVGETPLSIPNKHAGDWVVLNPRGGIVQRVATRAEAMRLWRAKRAEYPGSRVEKLPATETVSTHSLDITPSMKRDVLTKGQPRGFQELPDEPEAQRAGQQAAGQAAARGATGAGAPSPLQEQTQQTAQRLKDTADRLTQLTEQSRMALPEVPTVERTGTLSEPVRTPFRESFAKPETYRYEISEQAIDSTRRELIALKEEILQLDTQLKQGADPLAAHTSRFAKQQLDEVVAAFNRTTQRFRKERFAAGRAVKSYDRPPLSATDLARLKDAGALLEGLKVKEKLPLYTAIGDKLSRFGSLTPGERGQLAGETIDAFRLNLFPVLSFLRDIVGNASELAAQGVEAGGRDFGYAVGQGRFTAPNLQGFWRALRTAGRDLPQPVAEGIGARVTGEAGRAKGGFGPGEGTFTRRQTPVSTAVDYLVGTPLYLKGVTDDAARRFGAWTELWAEAIKAADAKGIKGGVDRRAFYESFLADTPKDVIDRVIAEGNKAGFNRSLGRLGTWVSSNRAVQLLADAFPRWPMQFSKAAGEWLGVYRPDLLARMKQGLATPEDVFGYLAKGLTGWGALYYLNQTLYDHVDFQSMEYVHDNGNRTRLSSLDPITTALWALAVLRGDEAKAVAGLKYASVPFARFADPDGGGGLISSFTNLAQQVQRNGRLDPRGVQRELESWLNRAIPGQAVLSLIKTLSDQTVREGVGANLPGVSQALPPVINRATGASLRPTQKLPGLETELPALGGTALPGAERVLDPVTQLLSRFGLLLYRGPKSAIAGVPPNEIPKELLREWQVELGNARQQLMLPLAQNADLLHRARRGTPLYEQVRKQVQSLDREAATLATERLRARHPGQVKLPRRPTRREQLLPVEPADDDTE